MSKLNKQAINIKALKPKYPIAQPMGITNSPSPNEADIMKLAVLIGVILKPYSDEIDKNSAYMHAKNIPKQMGPIQETALMCPSYCKISNTTALTKRHFNNNLSLCVIVPGA